MKPKHACRSWRWRWCCSSGRCVRFGVAMASIATSVCAMAATLSFALQRGVLATIGVNEGIDTLWGFLALLTVTGMFLTVLLAERNRMLRELAATAERYRRLFEHEPHPHVGPGSCDRPDPDGQREAIRHYGYSEDEWLALTVDDLAAKPASAELAVSRREYGLVETRHRLKSGVVIDVNLSSAPIDMDGRPTLLCFAVDVTERNALRREFLEATDLERRRLANELRYGLRPHARRSSRLRRRVWSMRQAPAKWIPRPSSSSRGAANGRWRSAEKWRTARQAPSG